MQIHRLRRATGTLLVVLATANSLSAAEQSLPVGSVADRIVIEKAAHTLALFRGDHLLKTYRVALGPNVKGAKERQGDGRTPEGKYIVDSRKRDSAFHRALHISYPNEQDRRRARRLGVPPGGDIMIHGLPNGMGAIGKAHRIRDWTQGCIAVTNEEIEEIWRVVPNGTLVEIKP
jgi:murein L,D-transpeptidase YafK